jgi:hypothetical protein
MLVADPCPWSLDHDPWEIPHTHAHAHVITTPGPWLRIAPCCRRPYLLTIEAA